MLNCIYSVVESKSIVGHEFPSQHLRQVLDGWLEVALEQKLIHTPLNEHTLVVFLHKRVNHWTDGKRGRGKTLKVKINTHMD